MAVVLPPLPKGTIRIRLEHQTLGKNWGVNWTISMGTSVTPTVSQLNSLAASVETEWKTEYLPALSTGTSYFQTVAEYHDGAGNIIVGSSASAAIGTDTNPTLPNSVCFILGYRIAAGYRGGKPRTYLSGMTQHLLGATPNSWATTLVAAFQTALNHSFTAINALTVGGAACIWGEISYFEDAAERAGTPPPVLRTVPLFRAFTSVVARPQLGHQRRRDSL